MYLQNILSFIKNVSCLILVNFEIILYLVIVFVLSLILSKAVNIRFNKKLL
jgi:hypothetical protein